MNINGKIITKDDFGIILNFALRYAIGRRTYAAKVVFDVVSKMIDELNDNTINCMMKDIERDWHDLGDDKIDRPIWVELYNLLVKRSTQIRMGDKLNGATISN